MTEEDLQKEWDDTNRHLEWSKTAFVSLHEKNSKDWSDTEKFVAREYREGAISLGEWRYWILTRARKVGIEIK